MNRIIYLRSFFKSHFPFGKLFMLIALLAMMMSACTDKHEKLTSEIKELEEKVKGQMMVDKVDGGKLLKKYIEFADAFPEDTLTPFVLYNGARVAMSIDDPGQSVVLLERLINSYPDNKITPEAYVLLGFVYETVYEDFDKAKYWYESFLKDFPNHFLWEDVNATLGFLGKSPDELVAEFLKEMEEEEIQENEN